MKKNGFTLAEVLITLTIIGIVAGMTIPSMINSTKNQEITARLRKFYSASSGAIKRMASDNGCTGDILCTGIFKDTGNKDIDDERVSNAIMNYFSIARKCSNNEDCFPIGKTYSAGTLSMFDPNATSAAYSYITNDGMSILVWRAGNHCDYNVSATGTGPLSKLCAALVVDVNAFKGPNTEGYDQFWFGIYSDGASLIPEGVKGSNKYWRDNNRCYQNPSAKDSLSCPARIIEEGWTMNY